VKPVLQAIILAEHIYQDKWTGKFVIAGTFNTIGFGKSSDIPDMQNAGDGPVRAPGMQAGSPSVYISLSELRKEEKFLLRYTDLEEDKVLFEVQLTVGSDSPLLTVELGIPLPSLLPEPHAGHYAIELLWNNELLGARHVTVCEIPKSTTEPDGET